MKIFDFNIHLPAKKHEDVNVVIDNDLNLDFTEAKSGYELHRSSFEKSERINVLLFNTKLFDDGPKSVYEIGDNKAVYTALIDFRRFDLTSYLEKVRDAGVKAIMFNSYLQQISEPDFVNVYAACKFAEANGMIICIDGSYGTSKMYAYDNLKLVCFIADLITRVPIVIVHSGGRRILEAMLLAQDKKNVWLDTSFSLPFYIGSSVEQDYAFAYKNVGIERVIYGSDHPYCDFDNVIKVHLDFFRKHQFKDSEIENIFYHNSMKLFSLA